MHFQFQELKRIGSQFTFFYQFVLAGKVSPSMHFPSSNSCIIIPLTYTISQETKRDEVNRPPSRHGRGTVAEEHTFVLMAYSRSCIASPPEHASSSFTGRHSLVNISVPAAPRSRPRGLSTRTRRLLHANPLPDRDREPLLLWPPWAATAALLWMLREEGGERKA